MAISLLILAGLPESLDGAGPPIPCPECPPCTNCPPVTNPPPYSVPGLKLTIPLLTNGNLLTTVFEADTNSTYDVFRRVVLQTNAPWFRAASGEIGQTNFALPIPATNSTFYIAAEYLDSDFDCLPDGLKNSSCTPPRSSPTPTGTAFPMATKTPTKTAFRIGRITAG